MPIVTLTEDNKTTYYPVSEADECRVDAVVDVYKLNEGSNSREYAEYELRKEYLRRLTEHALECAQLAHLVVNPPDDDEQIANLGMTDRLAKKIAEGAVWLRTYEPFTGLVADVAARKDKDGKETYGTGLQIDDEVVCSLDGDSWEATDQAMRAASPWRRDHFARMEQEKAEREKGNGYKSPKANQLIADSVSLLNKAIATEKRYEARKAKAVANKTTRRTKKARTA